MKSSRWFLRSLAVVMASTAASAYAATQLKLLSMQSNERPKKALESLVEKFSKENPDIQVSIQTIEHEAFKANIKKNLGDSNIDLITWHAGNRARTLAERGLLLPISDAVKNIDEFSAGVRSSVTFNGKLYAVPHAYYHWTIYYNQKAFETAGIKEPPKDWKGMLAAVNALKAKNITPIALGTKESWTAGGYFDLLGMHTYGYNFHMKLLNGEESFTNPKVKSSLGHWVELAKAKAFPEKHRELDWKAAAKMLTDGQAGMMLQGNFWIGETNVPLQGSGIESMKFPAIEKQPPAAVAPTEIIAGSAKSKNKDAVKKFLAFVARADVQEENAKNLQILPTNSKAKIDENDPFSKFGAKMLNEAKGISQFFDRDADPEVARVGMDALVNLIDNPGDLDKEIARLEETRKKIYRK